MDRRFPIHSGAQVITCGVAGCGKTAETGRGGGSAGGKLPPVAAARFFTHMGWKVGPSPRKDRCPDHALPHRKEAPKVAQDRTDVVVPLSSKIAGASELPPREMTKIDRRLIIQKLEDVYLDETTGYSTGWNDQRVAEDMKVPRIWVETIREENFGPQKADQSAEVMEIKGRLFEIDGKLAELTLDATSIRREAEVCASKAAEVQRISRELVAQAERLKADVRKLTGAR